MIFLVIFLAGIFYDLFKVNLLGLTSIKLLVLVFVLKIIGANFRLKK